MSQRIVLIDLVENPNYVLYFAAGLGDNIWTFTADEKGIVTGLDDDQINTLKSLGEGDAIMTVGANAFKLIRKFHHVGLRKETFSDAAKLPRLSIEGGAYLKEILDFPTKEEIEYFNSDDITKKVVFPKFQQRVIHTLNEATDYLNWCINKPKDEDFGFDYEASGMPMDVKYELSGFSLSTLDRSSFISLTDIRHELGVRSTETCVDARYNNLLKLLADFLFSRMSHIWTFNMDYEYRASHRMLRGVDLYDLSDASVVNVITGYHFQKKYSLKWSAQMWLGVEVWDSEFDRISDLVDKMLFTTEKKEKTLRVSRDNYTQTDEWRELCSRYPNYVNEFKALIDEYWGNPFMVIPSEILGYYCNLDAFYTLQIYLSQKDNYPEECWKSFMDNARLAVRLGNGLYIDESYRKKYSVYSQKMMAYGVTYCAAARCWLKMSKHKNKAASTKNYSKESLKLLSEGRFFGGDTKEITKFLYLDNLDTTDTSDTGLNEGLLVMKMGSDFAQDFIDSTKRIMEEIKFKGKIDEGIGRKKKILTLMGTELIRILKLDGLDLGARHLELEKYIYYEKSYKELYKIGKNQLYDINNIPDTVYAFKKTWSLEDYSKEISDSFFKCTSPQENDEIAYEFADRYRHQTAYLSAIFESSQQLPKSTKFYSDRGITDINQGYNEFMEEWKKYYSNSSVVGETRRGEDIIDSSFQSNLYPDKAFKVALDNYQSLKRTKDTKKSLKTGVPVYIYKLGDTAKSMWTDFNGWNAQAMFFNNMIGQYEEYSKPFEPDDYKEDFFFMRKFTLMYLLFKKHVKVESTYVGDKGMLKKTAKWVIEDKKHIPIRYATGPDEPGAVEKLFIHYEVNTKSSKRWSSPFHTIISHSDLKNAICCPPSYDQNGNIIYGGDDYLMTYFDINITSVV